MAKIIVSCRFQKSVKDIADLIRYMATREGVEKLPDTKKYKIATQSQHDLILSVVKHFPQSKKFLEYEDFYAMPTRENANEFLDAVAERYADRADELKGLVSYISNRPGVEKLGSHGLFTQFDMPIDLDTVRNVSLITTALSGRRSSVCAVRTRSVCILTTPKRGKILSAGI